MLAQLSVQRRRLAAGDVVLFGEPAFFLYMIQRSQMFFGSAFVSCLACQQSCHTQKSHGVMRRGDGALSFKTLSDRCA